MSLTALQRHLDPKAGDVGASYSSATIVLADTSKSYDLNDYWTPGQLVYVSQSVIDNKSIANCPSTTGGLLEVVGSSQNLIVQQYTAVGDGLLYTRHKAITSGNISGWGGANGIRTETNSNGSWLKLPDGTLIQWGIIWANTDSDGRLLVTYPVAFVGDAPRPIVTPTYSTTKLIFVVSEQHKLGSFMVKHSRPDGENIVGAEQSDGWIAIGRWK